MKDFDFNDVNNYLEHVMGFVAIDMEGRVRFLTQQCAAFFGYGDNFDTSSLIGKHISEIYPSTQMVKNLAPDILEPQLVFYSSRADVELSINIPIIHNGVKVGLVEYDIVQEERALSEFTDKYNRFLKEEVDELRQSLASLEGSKYTIDNITGSSEAILELKEKIKTIAKSHSTVLITGETGTGKELVAHAIHNLSSRRHRPMAKLNAASFPENLVESELFGYEKGAFTGANKEGKIGKFEYANKGTLFIDEINQMPLSVQPKLLRALQEHEIEPIGSNVAKHVDVRIIAASNQDISRLVQENRFREDLFYRLNVISVELPPLRARLEDIDEIASAHIRSLNMDLGFKIKGIDAEAVSLLKKYSWPGNVRELKNAIERAMNFAKEDILTVSDFEFLAVPDKPTRFDQYSRWDNPIEAARNRAEKEVIEEVLLHFGYNKSQAADFLHISRTALYKKIDKLNIKTTE